MTIYISYCTLLRLPSNSINSLSVSDMRVYIRVDGRREYMRARHGIKD